MTMLPRPVTSRDASGLGSKKQEPHATTRPAKTLSGASVLAAVTYILLRFIDDLCTDLVAAVGESVRTGARAGDRGTTYGTV